MVGVDTYTPLAGAAFLVIPGEEDIVAAADRLAAGQSATGLALVSALWARYCAGVSDSARNAEKKIAIASVTENWR